MFSVAPSGAQNRVARCEQPPSFSHARIVTGSVALELAVANAVASGSRIDHMIDLRHPLAVLASRMPWQEIEAQVAQAVVLVAFLILENQKLLYLIKALK
jgi:hypothetical protein